MSQFNSADAQRADALRRYSHLQWCATVMPKDGVLCRVFAAHPGLLASITKRMEALRVELGIAA
jgi:hypothetical protein